MSDAAPPEWTPPWTLEERVVNALVPGWLTWRLRARKAWNKARKPELRLLEELVDPARTSVDVGANRGVFTYYLARLSTHVHAYEPHPKMAAILARATRGRNVTVSRAALSDTSGAGRLVIPSRADGGVSNQRATLRQDLHPDPAGTCQVTTRRLDDEDVGQVGFMKIDVEGCELAVLRGAAETLRAHKPVLLIEIYERWSGVPVEESLATVCDLGYAGFFFTGGARRSLDEFDPLRNHRQPDPGALARDFLFVPR